MGCIIELQDVNFSIRDYLRKLVDLADTAGDIDECEIVRQFWINRQPYIKASLIDKGYEPNAVSLEIVQRKDLRTERAYLENAKDTNSLLVSNLTLAAGYASHMNLDLKGGLKPSRNSYHQ
jgi:hypothetical protein